MKILLTGSTGMVGRNILDHPDSKDYEFICPTRKQLNLLNEQDVYDYVRLHSPDLIIHAAGKVGGIIANIQNPVNFLTQNVKIGINIVLASLEAGVPRLINLGSSCMYPKNAKNPLSEHTILSGSLEPTNEGYALSKIIIERLCKYINKENPSFQYKTIIPCNIFGKYDDFEINTSHLIPAIIRKTHEAIESNQKIVIWGNGSAKREFMYAGDLADFLFHYINLYDSIDDSINVGLGYDFTINEYYKKVANIMNYKEEFIFDYEKPVGMQQKLVNIEKQRSIGWEATHTLHEGLNKTIDYFYNKII